MTENSVNSTPTVANGVVYITSDNNVYALNANTGKLVWIYATGGDVYSSPAVANGVVYVMSDDHNVYALNAITGAPAWSAPFTGYKGPNSGAISTSLAIVQGVIYVGGPDGVYAIGNESI